MTYILFTWLLFLLVLACVYFYSTMRTLTSRADIISLEIASAKDELAALKTEISHQKTLDTHMMMLLSDLNKAVFPEQQNPESGHDDDHD